MTAQDLVGEKLIVSKRAGNQATISSWFKEYYNEHNIFATYNLIGNAALLVKEGLGVALAIDGAVSLYDKESIIWKPLYPEIELSSILIWKKYHDFSPSVKKFIDFVIMQNSYDKQ